MSRSRAQTWLVLIVLAVGLLAAAVAGHFVYMNATATPLHPSAQDVPSVTRTAPSSKWTDAVAQAQPIVRAEITEQNLPGISIAVGVGSDLVWAEGFGWADLENHARVAPETRFRIGGVSMALTSAAVGLLLEKGKLKLDDEIQTYVPAFPKKQWPVTLRQLMGHMAGVRGDAGDEESMSERCLRTADGLRRFAESPLRFEPGTQYHYSPYGWILVSAAVDNAAGEPFFSFMRTQILAPVGMDDTTPDSPTESPANRATFYYPRFQGNNRYGPEAAREGDYSCFAGAGGILSTPSDLVRFGMAINNGKLLQRATVEMLQAPQRLNSGADTGYGLGWDLESVPLAGQSARIVGHDSEYIIGGSASLLTFPERGIVVAVTTNTTYADTNAVAVKIARVFAEHGPGPARK